jgi:hypothetical protein
MNSLKMKRLWLGVAALATLAFAGSAQAASSVSLDITVTIAASKSLSVSATTYAFGAVAVNSSTESTTAITVTNNSGALVETYAVTGANAPSQDAGTTWTLASSPGTDTYVLGAMFSTAQPGNLDASWTTSLLNNATPVVCSATNLGNGTAGESGASVLPAATRSLWFRMKTPTAISDAGAHKATITLAVN